MSSSRIVFGYDAETLVDLAVTEIFRHGLMGNVGDVVALGQLLVDRVTLQQPPNFARQFDQRLDVVADHGRLERAARPLDARAGARRPGGGLEQRQRHVLQRAGAG